MQMAWGLLVLGLMALVLAACAFFGKDLERDAAVYYGWAKRGQTVGDLAHVYCDQGSFQERQVFMYSLGSASQGARVTITCPKPGSPFVTPEDKPEAPPPAR